jgi:hypothetical protein
MNITQYWQIEQLEIFENYHEFENVVAAVQWTCHMVSTDAVSTNCGWSHLPLPTNNENFIPYHELTPEQVLTWAIACHSQLQWNTWATDSIRQIANISGYTYQPVENMPWDSLS